MACVAAPDNCAMGNTFDKPSIGQRLLPLFRGFDGWLLLAVLPCVFLAVRWWVR